MGTQQILMIILSVIVVGTAIAVGIQMFDTQLENSTRQALAAELMQQAAQAQAYFRTPTAMGGGGNGKSWNTTPPAANDIAKYINNKAGVAPNAAGEYTNMHGKFTLSILGTIPTDPRDTQVQIVGESDVDSAIQATAVFAIGRGSANDNINVSQN